MEVLDAGELAGARVGAENAENSLTEKIATLVKPANVTVESYWPSLFAKLLEKRSVEDLILSAGSGGGGAVAVAPTTSGGAAAAAGGCTPVPAAEEKKEEPKEESDDDMGFSLFD